MLATHDLFTRQMRNRLKIAIMGLGLMRLLQDAGRTEEARTTLYSLETGFQAVAEKSDMPTRRRGFVRRHRGTGRQRRFACLHAG